MVDLGAHDLDGAAAEDDLPPPYRLVTQATMTIQDEGGGILQILFHYGDETEALAQDLVKTVKERVLMIEEMRRLKAQGKVS
jgi:hypothetical protein